MSNQKPKTNRSQPSSDDDIGGNVSDSFIIKGDGNTINVGGKNTISDSAKKKTHSRKPKKPNVLIVVAWIGFFATVLAALISVFGKGFSVTPSPTPAPATVIVFTETITPTVIPTDTVLPGEPSFTPVPVTDTPVPTFTPVPVTIGEDWLAGCISTLWRVYPSNIPMVERGDGCWKEPLHNFSAENGDLDFLAERGKGTTETYGLFAPLPESGTVTFTIRLKELSNVDLWMGVFAEPEIESQGILMTILNGDVNRRAFVQKDPFTYETIQGSQAVTQENGYSISFTFTNLSVTSIVNPSVFVTNSVSIPSAQKWLFLGYKGLTGAYRIEGTFLNFELK